MNTTYSRFCVATIITVHGISGSLSAAAASKALVAVSISWRVILVPFFFPFLAGFSDPNMRGGVISFGSVRGMQMTDPFPLSGL